jgi:hypothetical protein
MHRAGFVVMVAAASAVAQQWVPIDVAPPARSRHGMVTDTWRNRVVLFGGLGREDVWTFDGAVWSPLIGAQPAPPRDRFASCFGAARGEIVLFGGYDPLGGGVFRADTWCWNGTWQQRTPAVSPPGLWSPQMAYDAARQRVVLVDTWFPATWEWDGTSWTAAATPPFSPRSGAGDDVRQRPRPHRRNDRQPDPAGDVGVRRHVAAHADHGVPANWLEPSAGVRSAAQRDLDVHARSRAGHLGVGGSVVAAARDCGQPAAAQPVRAGVRSRARPARAVRRHVRAADERHVGVRR